MTSLNKWDIRFLDLAKQVATWSKDPDKQVGCVLVKDKRIVSVGFNGFPKNCDDDEERYKDKELKRSLIVHAEINAILNAAYIGASTRECTLYTTLLPCLDCSKTIITSGINKVIGCTPLTDSNWSCSCRAGKELLEEAGIEVICTSKEAGEQGARGKTLDGACTPPLLLW